MSSDTTKRITAGRLADGRYEALFRHSAVGIALADLDGRVIEANPALQAMLGYSQSELLKMTFGEFTHPDDLEQEMALVRELWAGVRQDYRLMKRYVRKDGNTLWVYVSVSLIRDEDGHPTHAIATVEDVTEQKETERALAESEGRKEAELNALIESIPGAVFIGDENGVTRINRMALDLLGYDSLDDLRDSAEVLRALSMRNARTGEPVSVEDNVFVRALRGEAAASEVVIRHKKSGQERILHGSARPIRLSDGSPAAVLVTADITDQRRAEDTVRFLAQASLVLAESLDYQTTLTAVANLVVPRLADWCAIDLLGDDGLLERVVVTHADPEKQAWAKELGERYPPRQDENSAALRVAQAGRPELYPDIPDELLVTVARDEEHLKLLRQVGMRSAMVVPLTARGRTLGAITLIFAEAERRYTRDDLPAVEELARSCGLAVDNARLYREAQHEIEERRRAEEEVERLNRDLRRRVEELQTLLDVSPVGLAVAHDPEGNHITTNPAFAEMLGIDPLANASKSGPEGEALPFKVLRDGREVRPEELPMQLASRRGLTTRGDELEIERSDGKRLVLLEYASPLYDEHGKLRGSLGAFVDITDLKRTQSDLRQLNETLEQRVRERTEALEEANTHLRAEVAERQRAERALERTNAALVQRNRELQEFAYVASHDLQEPLRKIHSFADLLRTEYRDKLGEEGQMYIERIQNASSRMSGLIQDLLQFSRIATQVQPFERVDLNRIVADVLYDLEVAVQASGGRVDVSDLPEVEADPLQMRQLFQNLIGNALKFRRADAPPIVQIRGRVEEDGRSPRDPGREWCRLEVEDNGIGFEEKYLDRIFSPFQRLHGRGEYEGTGMGLAICRRIAERHHGSITARSTPGQGSTFVVTLPVHQPEQDPNADGGLGY